MTNENTGYTSVFRVRAVMLDDDLDVTRRAYEQIAEVSELPNLTMQQRMSTWLGTVLGAIEELETKVVALSRTVHGDIREEVPDDTEA